MSQVYVLSQWTIFGIEFKFCIDLIIYYPMDSLEILTVVKSYGASLSICACFDAQSHSELAWNLELQTKYEYRQDGAVRGII